MQGTRKLRKKGTRKEKKKEVDWRLLVIFW